MLRQSKQGSSHQKTVQSIKVCTNDSIGTFSPGLYILYLLKLPAPPRADLSGMLEGGEGERKLVSRDLCKTHRMKDDDDDDDG